jgi:hypothetical protein
LQDPKIAIGARPRPKTERPDLDRSLVLLTGSLEEETMRLITSIALVCYCLLLAACQTSDSSLREQGRSDAYVAGFHDGRHSGMQEAGNFLEHFVQDKTRFESDPEYRDGWLAGETEGKRIQQEANGAVGVYSAYDIGKEAGKATDYDRIGQEAVKDVDTSGLKTLDKN